MTLCAIAECEARRLQREREREEELQQRLQRQTGADDKQHQRGQLNSVTTQQRQRPASPPSSASSALNPTDSGTNQHSTPVNHDTTPVRAPARAPTLKQSAGNVTTEYEDNAPMVFYSVMGAL